MSVLHDRDLEKQRDRERAHLLRAALAVMRRNGYANANITDILAQAQISTRAFYRHFASKDDLLIALFRDIAEKTRLRLEARISDAETPAAQLLAWIDEILDMGYDTRRRVSRLFAADAVQAALADAGHEAAARLYAPLQEVLAAGAASGVFPTCDPVADAGSIHAIVWRLFDDAIRGRAGLDREAARAHVLRFVLPALGVTR